VGARPTFVGRARERAGLQDAAQHAEGGARQVVFIGGEPGVGKSRIVAETAQELDERGSAVLLGTCSDAMGAPYQPFVEPIGVLLSAVVAGDLVLDWTAEERDRKLGSLRTIVGAERPRADDDGEQLFARQLFDVCADVISAAAVVRPLVLVLEDVQWAGDTALRLLRHVVGRTTEARLLILVTQRTTAPDRSAALVSTVAELYRSEGVRRLDIDGLSTEEITEFLVHESGGTPRVARAPAAVLRDLTGGNPFLLQEVWREAASRGGLPAIGDVDLHAPETLLDSVSHRLTGLPAVHRGTVETAAVIGEEVSIALLTAVARHAGSEASAAAVTYAGLEAAAAVGLLESVRGVDCVFGFPHGLARQAVLDLMTDYRRAVENARVAEVLEAEFPAAELWVQRLAHHYAGAQALGYADKAVQYLAAAAAAAETAVAHHEAARLFERAAAIASTPVDRDELRLRAARSYLRSSQFGRARDLNESIAASTHGLQRLRAAVGLEAASWRTGEPGERSVEALTSALAEIDLGDSDPMSIRGIAALGRAQAFTGDRAASASNGARAVALARATGEESLLATALQIGLQLDTAPSELSDKLARATELTELAKKIGELRHLGPASYHRAAICYVQGDPSGFATAHNDLARAARVTGQPFWAWVESCLTYGAAFLRADFAGATRIIADAGELSRSFEHGRETAGPSGLQTYMVRRETGQLDQVRGLISGTEDVTGYWAPGLLALYCELGLRDPAARVLGFLLDRDLPRHQMSATWPIVLSFLADAAIWLSDPVSARRLLPLALPYAGLNLMGGEFLALVGSADRQIGALESLLGRPTADDRFAAALEMDSRMGSPLHLAATQTAIVAHLHRTGRDATRAAEIAGQARALCGRYGLARVGRMLEAIEGAGPGRAPSSQGLTSREAEVLGLLGQGLSNRRIAEALFISENTAANHVRSILMKTGAANRTQAAMFASGHGLLDRQPATVRRSARDGVQ